MKENRNLKIIFILLAVVILIAHFGFHTQMANLHNVSNHQDGQKNEKKASSMVQIKNYSFVPANIKIKKGTRITWENYDIAPHTVTVDDPNQKGPKSKLFGKGEKFSYKFSEAGVYSYHCEPHPYMKAIIEVTE